MKNILPGFYHPSDEEFKILWEKCIFVLDANVLLNLYRYPKPAREDLIRVLKKISNRLWIPHQVALEYQKNRLNVIAEQINKFDEVRNIINKIKTDLNSELTKLQLNKRHSAINPESFLERVNNTFEEFLTELEKTRENQPDVDGEDALRDIIDGLLNGKVGKAYTSQGQLDSIYSNGKTRYDLQCPPGFGDHTKNKTKDGEPPSYIWSGLTYQREFGDLILWNQILDKAKDSKWEYLIFITDDQKDDWWWTIESRGKKTIGPRPELVEEMITKGEVELLYIYNTGRFLKYAKKYLKVNIEQESIDQVRDIVNQNFIPSPYWKRVHSPYIHVVYAVYEWLCNNFPKDEISINETGYPDLLRISLHNNSLIGYEVKYYPNQLLSEQTIKRRIADAFIKASYRIRNSKLSAINIVIVLDESINNESLLRFAKGKPKRSVDIRMIFGCLVTEEGYSNPLFKYISEV